MTAFAAPARRPRTPRRRKAGGRRSVAALGMAVAAVAVAAVPPVGGSAARAAGDPQADYVALFGDEEKRVLATAATKDDAAFAAKLLAKAAELKDDPALQRFVYERAVALGQKDPDGLDAAVSAAKLLAASADAADQPSWRAKLLDLQQAQYKRATGAKRAEAGAALVVALEADVRALAAKGKHADAARRMKEAQSVAAAIRSSRADELADAAKELQARQQAAERLDKLRARLDAQGGDIPTLEQAILGYLLEVDDPAAAAALAATHPDKAWERMLALAAKPPAELPEDDALALADFFRRATANKAAPAAVRRPAAERAWDLLAAFVKVHERQDAARAKAKQEMDALAKLIESLPGGSAAKVVVWNTYHGRDHSAGAAAVNVVALSGGAVVWRRDDLPIEWTPGKDTFVAVAVPRAFDAVRVEVTRWNASAGGLSEVQVYRGKTNVAAGRPVTASGSYTDQFPPSALTDGVTTSAEINKGYWLLPLGKPGWAEVSLKP